MPDYDMNNGGWNQGGPGPNGGGPGYPPQWDGQSQQGGYPPQQGGYPPQQGGYPPQQGGYPPQQGGYPPQQGGYGDQQNYQGYQDNGYEDNGFWDPNQGIPMNDGYEQQRQGFVQRNIFKIVIGVVALVIVVIAAFAIYTNFIAGGDSNNDDRDVHEILNGNTENNQTGTNNTDDDYIVAVPDDETDSPDDENTVEDDTSNSEDIEGNTENENNDTPEDTNTYPTSDMTDDEKIEYILNAFEYQLLDTDSVSLTSDTAVAVTHENGSTTLFDIATLEGQGTEEPTDVDENTDTNSENDAGSGSETEEIPIEPIEFDPSVGINQVTDIGEYELDDKITVETSDGTFEFRVTGIKETDLRNSVSETSPLRVMIINYEFTNISIDSELSITPYNFVVYDATGAEVSEYYIDVEESQPASRGASSKGQYAIALNSAENNIRLYYFENRTYGEQPKFLVDIGWR